MTELVLKSKRGVAVTNSLLVAQKFGKEHRHVLDSIRKIMTSAENSAHLSKMFIEAEFPDSYGRLQPMFVMNRDGFSLLVMGFTGKEALNFKLEFIEAFNKMEEQIKKSLPQTYADALRQLASEVEERETLEIALNQSLKFFTVAKYNKKYKKGWSLKECQEIGKQMSAYCRQNSIEVRRCETNDERFGTTNSYPLTAWESFL